LRPKDRSEEEEGYRQAFPTKTDMRYFPRTKLDIIFCLGYLPVILMAKVVGGSLLMILVMFLGIFLLVENQQNRLYSEPGSILRDFRITMRKNILWSVADSRRRHHTLMPFVAGVLGEYGFIFVPDTGEVSLLVSGEGSDTSSKDLSGQYRDHSAHAELTVDVSNTAGNASVAVSSVFRRGPLDVPRMESMFRANLHPGVLAPHMVYGVPTELEGIPPAKWATLDESELGIPRSEWSNHLKTVLRHARRRQALIGELPDVNRRFAGDVDMVYLVTMVDAKLSKKAQEAQKRGQVTRLTREDVERLPVEEVRSALEDGMENIGVISPMTLSGDDVRRYIRAGWDVADAGEYHRQLERGIDDDSLHWPQREISVTRKSIITDGTHHAVLKIVGTAGYPTPADMRPIYAVPVPWVSVAVVAETKSSAGEVKIWDRLLQISEAASEGFGIVRESRSTRDRRQELDSRTERIHRAKFKTDFVIYLRISATSAEELEKHIKNSRKWLRKLGMRSVRIRKKSAQLRYFLTASTGVNLS
jgi:hypothetical protein